MGRSPCCDADANMRRGPWLTEEDEKLKEYIEENGAGNWKNLPKLAGLNRCGKSCRLRWANYLRPDIKRGRFSAEEEQMIIHFHSILGNKWSAIAARLPGRTDNEIKNYWNTHLRKKLLNMGIDPVTHRPRTDHLNLLANVPLNLIAAAAANLSNLTQFTANPLLNALQLPQLQLLQNYLLQVMATNSSPPNLDAMNQLLGSPFLNGSLALRNPNLMALENLSNNNLLDTAMMPNLSINGTEAIAPMNKYGSSSWEHGDVENNCGGTSSSNITTTRTATSTPSLVPASPENSIAEKVQEPVNESRRNVAISSPTSKPFDAWGGLNLDELDSDLGWKDILNQIQWSDAL